MASQQVRKDTPPWVLLGGAFLVLAIAGTAAWFAIPDAQAQYRFASPSGKAGLDVGEYCDSKGCLRRVVADFVNAAGATVRFGCAIELPGTEPLLAEPSVSWAADEASARLVYAGGEHEFVFERDCTLTE